MNNLRKLVAASAMSVMACASIVPAHAQPITFYEYAAFGGRSISADRSLPDFDPLGFNDLTNSVIVRNGQWQVCTDAFFHGRCVTLGPGEYPNLGTIDMGNAISSARPLEPVTADGVIPAPPIPPRPYTQQPPPVYEPPQPYQAPQYQPPQYQPPRYEPPRPAYPGPRPPPVVLYEEYDFGGQSTAIGARVDNLDITQWNDRAVSMVINEGNWELCTDAFYRGTCNVFGPGSYRDIGNALVRQVSSLRPADNGRYPPPPGAYPPPPAYAPPANPPPAYAPPASTPPRAPLVILFSDHGLRGGTMTVDRDIPNLDSTSFNDRASSMRIEAGFWQFCTDAGYHGDCRTFGPGDYPNLPDGFEGRISSVRRVQGPNG